MQNGCSIAEVKKDQWNCIIDWEEPPKDHHVPEVETIFILNPESQSWPEMSN